MHKNVSQLKKIFNLTAYEAQIYLAALNFEKANLSELAENAGIPRTAVYHPLQSLMKKGLIFSVKIKKRFYYQALNPNQLHYIFDRRKTELDSLVTELSQKINFPDKKLFVSYYAGTIGIETAADILLEETKGKIGKSFEESSSTINLHGEKQMLRYIERRVEKGIKGKMILSGNPDSSYVKRCLNKDHEELRKTILVSPNRYPFNASMAVFDDILMIVVADENPFAILVKNKKIADTFSSIHDMAWDRFER